MHPTIRAKMKRFLRPGKDFQVEHTEVYRVNTYALPQRTRNLLISARILSRRDDDRQWEEVLEVISQTASARAPVLCLDGKCPYRTVQRVLYACATVE
jgi:hypothetical protein